MPVDYSKLPSPCYVLDEKRLRDNLDLISRTGREAGVKIILAFKAFALWKVFGIFREYIESAAASSLSEVMLCYEEMGAKAHTYSPLYKREEFDKIASMSSHMTFNSVAQYQRFREHLGQHKEVSAGLRINPEQSDIAHGLYNPCSPGSRFGVTADELRNGLPDGIEGLHFHVLFESDSYALEKTLKVVEEKFGHLLPEIGWINIGGGHLITNKEYDTAHLVKVLSAFREKYGLEIILEPGSAFAWETGELVSTVGDIVTNSGIRTAILDVSFTAHMPDCLEMPYKPAVIGGRDPEEGKPVYRLGGNSCLSGDFMGDWSFERELKPGDRIVFLDMMHYTMVKTTTFNGVDHPDIVLWRTDGSFEVLRSFGYSDYRNRLS
jgi:carboxynorspermidine decarboxylase